MRPLLVLTLLTLLASGAQAQDAKSKRAKRKAQKTEEGSGAEAAREKELAEEAAAWTEARRAEIERDAETHFQVCDLDGGGWVSFREAAATLGMEKQEFRDSDLDDDGRLDLEEFRGRYRRMLDLLGAAGAPVPSTSELQDAADRSIVELGIEPRERIRTKTPDPAAPTGAIEKAGDPPARSAGISGAPTPSRKRPRKKSGGSIAGKGALFPTPGELVARYDSDASGGLSLDEVRAVIADLGDDLSAEVIWEQTDRDQSGELDVTELGPLAHFASQRIPRENIPEGRRAARPVIPTNPLAKHFERLDENGDGVVDTKDLARRLDGARTSVRLGLVLSALDKDGSGDLDPVELRRAFERD